MEEQSARVSTCFGIRVKATDVVGSAANKSGPVPPPVTPVKVARVRVSVFSTDAPDAEVPPRVSRRTVIAFTACKTVTGVFAAGEFVNNPVDEPSA